MNQEQLQTLQKANYLNITGQYDSAIALYNQLQVQDSENYELCISKAIALQQLNNYESAIKECENAIVLDRKNPEGILRRGICNFYTGKFKAALIDFQDSKEKIERNPIQDRQVDVWISKCNAELNNTNLTELINQGGIKAPLSVQETNKKPQQQQPEQQKQQVNKNKITYTWYHTDNKVAIEINHQLQDKKSLNVKFTPSTLDLSFPISDSSNYELNLDLFGYVKPETVNTNVHLNKIEITVEKQNKGETWKQLTADVKLEEIKESKSQNPLPVKPASYPSSSKVKKDWSKIDAEIEEDIKKNKDDYATGEDPLNGLFKQIYAGADENTKRAMMKSFQTSGGTVLSTNWDEVASKDYEGKDRPSPPKGQKYADWNKQ